MCSGGSRSFSRGLLARSGAGLLPDRTLYVVARDAPARPAARDLGEVDLVLLGQLPHRRRGAARSVLDLPAPIRLLAGSLLGLGRRLLFLWLFVRLLGGCAVGFAYDTDHPADADGLPVALRYRLEDAVLLGLYLKVDLVGLQLYERLAGFHRVALLPEPLPYRRVSHRLPELRDVYLSRHVSPALSEPCPLLISVTPSRSTTLGSSNGTLDLAQAILPEGREDELLVLPLVKARRSLRRRGSSRLADVPER